MEFQESVEHLVLQEPQGLVVLQVQLGKQELMEFRESVVLVVLQERVDLREQLGKQ